jgi:hypothetical protein
MERCSESFSQNDASWNGVPEPFFSGINITSISPFQPNFGSLRIPELTSLEK